MWFHRKLFTLCFPRISHIIGNAFAASLMLLCGPTWPGKPPPENKRKHSFIHLLLPFLSFPVCGLHKSTPSWMAAANTSAQMHLTSLKRIILPWPQKPWKYSGNNFPTKINNSNRPTDQAHTCQSTPRAPYNPILPPDVSVRRQCARS